MGLYPNVLERRLRTSLTVGRRCDICASDAIGCMWTAFFGAVRNTQYHMTRYSHNRCEPVTIAYGAPQNMPRYFALGWNPCKSPYKLNEC